MTLTQQFLLILLLPLSFVAMVVYLWREQRRHRMQLRRRGVFWRWTWTLLLGAVWSSSVVRYFGGTTFSAALVSSWEVVGYYALSATAVALLLTTVAYLTVARGQARVALGLTLLLLAVAVALDPVLWRYAWPAVTIAGVVVSQVAVWTAVWVTSWLLPVIACWLMGLQLKVDMPVSLYRNQVNYWFLVIFFFFVSFSFGSVRQAAWQQVGMLVLIGGSLMGTVTVTRTVLPNLQIALRQVISRLFSSLVIFGLTLLALWLLVRAVTTLPEGTPDSTQTLILLLAAAIFAAFFTFVYRWVTELTRRIFLPTAVRRDIVSADFRNVVGNLPDPVQLGNLFLRLVQSNLATDDAWLFDAADGPGGRLVLRPLATLGAAPREVADFAYDSPFATYLRESDEPVMQFDLDALEKFADIPQAERELLLKWQRVFYKPLHAGDSLIAVLAVGSQYTGEGYTAKEYDLLNELAVPVGPLLAQARNLASLGKINEYVFQENQRILREKRHLQELTQLYGQFLGLISPDLRRPFTDINRELQKYQSKAGADGTAFVTEMNNHLSTLKAVQDNLITLAARIQSHAQFHFQPVHMDELAQDTIRLLHGMAEARRVKVDFFAEPTLPAVLGDAQQLQEALHHVMHNAIKFNKIGGLIMVQCGVEESHVFVRVLDNGVGIPQERLAQVWAGFAGLKGSSHGRFSGVGLTLAQFVVQAHGGEMTVESKYGFGSTFTLYLPLMDEE